MIKTSKALSKVVLFSLPVLVLLSSILISNSPIFATNPKSLSAGITIDLLLLLPLLYFIAIRQTKIPRVTLIPVLILGVVLATFIIPKAHQQTLNSFKTWVLPVIEIAILSFIIYKVSKAIKYYKSETQVYADFYTLLKKTCNSILPNVPAHLAATELSVIYYGFINWKKTKLKNNEFTHHKTSGTVSLLVALLFIIAIETVTLHFILSKWSSIIAWILTGLSIYTGLQIFGFLKSMSKRPLIVDNDELWLRYGIMSETKIPLHKIDTIELSSKSYGEDKYFKKLSILGDLESHNIVIHLKEEQLLHGLYGIKKPYKILALYADDKEAFVDLVKSKII